MILERGNGNTSTVTLFFGMCLDISPFIFMLLETYNFSTLCIACSSSSVATPKIYINNSQNVAWLFFKVPKER